MSLLLLFNGDTGTERLISATILVTSSVTDSLSIDRGISVSCSVESTISGSVDRWPALTTSIECTSSVSDIPVTIDSYISIQPTVCTADVTGALVLDISYSTSISCESSSTVHIVYTYSLSCAIGCSCNIPETILSRDVSLVGTTIECTSSCSGVISGLIVWLTVTAVDTESSVSAQIGRTRIITGLIGGSASLTAALDTSPGLVSSLGASASVGGQPYTLYISGSYTPPNQYIEITWEGT